ncbi:MAG: RNA polymerase sigma factor [Ignavibacteriae bacterium]|nr:RNA polymerase sigma factor [Ignavibacteriota bacterium]
MDKELENLSDAELFKLMSAGEARTVKAFEEIYTRYSPRVYAYCRRYLGNREEAEDVFQETFIRFYNSRQSIREMTNLGAFLLKIARNQCINLLREIKRNSKFDEEIYIKHDDRDENDELLNLIKMAIELLPDEYKEIFIMREYNGLKYNDIADITGLSINTVKIKIFRARERIRHILQPYLSEMSK